MYINKSKTGVSPAVHDNSCRGASHDCRNGWRRMDIGSACNAAWEEEGFL